MYREGTWLVARSATSLRVGGGGGEWGEGGDVYKEGLRLPYSSVRTFICVVPSPKIFITLLYYRNMSGSGMS